MTLALGFEFAAFKLLFLTHVIFGLGRPAAEQLKVTLEPKKNSFVGAKINSDTTNCMHSDSLYSCKQRFTFEDLFGDDSKLLLLTGLPQNPLLKTKLNKKRQKNHKQCPSNVHGVRN